jgi:hypothetical protein
MTSAWADHHPFFNAILLIVAISRWLTVTCRLGSLLASIYKHDYIAHRIGDEDLLVWQIRMAISVIWNGLAFLSFLVLFQTA